MPEVQIVRLEERIVENRFAVTVETRTGHEATFYGDGNLREARREAASALLSWLFRRMADSDEE